MTGLESGNLIELVDERIIKIKEEAERMIKIGLIIDNDMHHGRPCAEAVTEASSYNKRFKGPSPSETKVGDFKV